MYLHQELNIFLVSMLQVSRYCNLLFSCAGNESGPKNGLHPYRIAYTNTYGKPPWFNFVRDEYEACREQVGLSDYSSFTKIDFWVCMVPATGHRAGRVLEAGKNCIMTSFLEMLQII